MADAESTELHAIKDKAASKTATNDDIQRAIELLIKRAVLG